MEAVLLTLPPANVSSSETVLNDANETILYSHAFSSVSIYDKCSQLVLNFVIAFYAFFWIVGFPANVITIAALVKCIRMQNATTLFIINLCIVDGILCFFIPPLAIPTVVYRRWVMSSIVCKFYALIRYAYISVSLWTIAAIAINRFIMIVCSGSYRNIYTKKSTLFMILIIWLVSLILLIPPLSGHWGTFGYLEETGTCTILPDAHQKTPKTFLLTVFIVVPTLSLLICYPLIYFTVWRSTRIIQEHSNTIWHGSVATLNKVPVTNIRRPRIDSAGSDVSSVSFTRTGNTRKSKEMKILRLVLAIFCTFVGCYFPLISIQLFCHDQSNNHPSVVTIGYVTIYLSACLNPIIYVVVSREYRSAYKSLLYKSPWSRQGQAQDGIKSGTSEECRTRKSVTASMPSA